LRRTYETALGHRGMLERPLRLPRPDAPGQESGEFALSGAGIIFVSLFVQRPWPLEKLLKSLIYWRPVGGRTNRLKTIA